MELSSQERSITCGLTRGRVFYRNIFLNKYYIERVFNYILVVYFMFMFTDHNFNKKAGGLARKLAGKTRRICVYML